MRKIDNIVLHHTADELDTQTIRRYHTSKGWTDIFYHYIIEKDGRIVEGRNIKNISSASRKRSIEIAVIGKLHEREIYDVQVEGLKKLIKRLNYKYNINHITGHNKHTATECPASLDVNYFNNFLQLLELDHNSNDIIFQSFDYDINTFIIAFLILLILTIILIFSI